MSDLIKYSIIKVKSLDDMHRWERIFARETDQIYTRFGPNRILIEIEGCSIDPDYPYGYLIRYDDDFTPILRRLYHTENFLTHYELSPEYAEKHILYVCSLTHILDE